MQIEQLNVIHFYILLSLSITTREKQAQLRTIISSSEELLVNMSSRSVSTETIRNKKHFDKKKIPNQSYFVKGNIYKITQFFVYGGPRACRCCIIESILLDLSLTISRETGKNESFLG